MFCTRCHTRIEDDETNLCGCRDCVDTGATRCLDCCDGSPEVQPWSLKVKRPTAAKRDLFDCVQMIAL